MVTTSAAYGSMGLVPTLVAERAVYLRERADGLYLPITYLASTPARQVFTEAPKEPIGGLPARCEPLPLVSCGAVWAQHNQNLVRIRCCCQVPTLSTRPTGPA